MTPYEQIVDVVSVDEGRVGLDCITNALDKMELYPTNDITGSTTVNSTDEEVASKEQMLPVFSFLNTQDFKG